MKISHKLVGSFLSISILTGVVGGVAIAQSYKIAKTLAIAEAEDVAEVLATAIVHDYIFDREATSLERLDHLQSFADLLHDQHKRDIIVVNRQKTILASAVHPQNVGKIFEHDQENEIQQTMQDGRARTFLEESTDYPQGIKLIVIPLKTHPTKIEGAVIVEWSSLYNDAIAQAKPTIIAIGITSLGCLIFALLLGLSIASSISKPLQAVTAVAKEATETANFDLQAGVTTTDETGTLAAALNALIQHVKVLLNEQAERTEELRQRQDQLIQQEKMAALGQLVAGIAHEINNPLGAIQASASNTYQELKEALLELPHLYQRLNSQEQEIFFELIHRAINSKLLVGSQEIRALKRKTITQLQEYNIEDAGYIADLLIDMNIYENLEFLLPLLKGNNAFWVLQLAYNLTGAFTNNRVILNAVARSSKIVFALKSYSRYDQSVQKQLLNVTDGLETVLEIYHNKLKGNIHVVREYQNLPPILGYPDELIQVWTNLIHNAIQAMKSGGTLTISTYQQEQGIEVSITDTGCGISSEVQPKIFDAFFTTKSAGEGSGLGLYICQKIIDKHQGHIWVESHPGHTQFRIELPIKSV